FERILGASLADRLRLPERGDIVAERLGRRTGRAVRRHAGIAAAVARSGAVGAQAFEVNEELGHAALDRLGMTEAALRRSELFDRLGDPVLEPAERELLAARELLGRDGLQVLDPVAERADHLVEMLAIRLRIALRHLQAFDLVAEPADQLIEMLAVQ